MTATPRDTTPPKYGPEYEQLLLSAWEHCQSGEPFRLPFANEKLASSMRQKMYAYFRALRREGLRMDLVERADAVNVRAEGAVMVILRVEDSWDHVAIREALGLKKGFAYEGMAPDGSELHIPDIASNRLMSKLQEVRERNRAERESRPSSVVAPLKNT